MGMWMWFVCCEGHCRAVLGRLCCPSRRAQHDEHDILLCINIDMEESSRLSELVENALPGSPMHPEL